MFGVSRKKNFQVAFFFTCLSIQKWFKTTRSAKSSPRMFWICFERNNFSNKCLLKFWSKFINRTMYKTTNKKCFPIYKKLFLNLFLNFFSKMLILHTAQTKRSIWNRVRTYVAIMNKFKWENRERRKEIEYLLVFVSSIVDYIILFFSRSHKQTKK